MGSLCGHMTARRDLFVDYREPGDLKEIQVATGVWTKVEGTGAVGLWAQDHYGDWSVVTIRDCLHVPDFHPHLNLISIGPIVDNCKTATFDRSKVVIFDESDGSEFFAATRVDGSYMMVAAPLNSEPPTGKALSAHARDSANREFRLWYRRLGHLSESAMRDLARNESLEGVDTELDHRASGLLRALRPSQAPAGYVQGPYEIRASNSGPWEGAHRREW